MEAQHPIFTSTSCFSSRWPIFLAAAVLAMVLLYQINFGRNYDMKNRVFRGKSFATRLMESDKTHGAGNLSTNFTVHLIFEPSDGQNETSKNSVKYLVNHDNLTLLKELELIRDDSHADVACKYPILDPLDKSILKYIGHPKPFNCKPVQPYLSSMDKEGFVTLNSTEAQQWNSSGLLSCQARTVDRAKGKDDDAVAYGTPKPMTFNSSGLRFPEVDTVEVKCFRRNGLGVDYHNLHNHPKQISKPIKDSTEDQLSVFMFGLDSVSQSMFRRHLPKTYQFLMDQMKLRVFQGYVKVADNTYPNLMAMLTGKRAYSQQNDMPNELPGMPQGKQFDDWYLVWKKFAEKNYVTSFVEDKPAWGLFHYLMSGFAEKPTDHYLRPFFLARGRAAVDDNGTRWCFGNVPRYAKHSDISLRLLRRYKSKRHFTFSFYTELTHDYESELERSDDLFLEFFQNIHRENMLNRTIMFVYSDHGHRFARLRETLVGLLEERMPMFGVYMPPWFYKRYPNIDKAIRINQKRLSAPFDVHQTLLDIVNANYSAKQLPKSTRSLSQLYEIPPERNCTEAGIPDFYCVCSQGKNVNVSDTLVQKAAKFLVDHVNNLLSKTEDLCSRLTLQSVIRAEMFEVNQKVAHGVKAAEEAKNFVEDHKEVTMKTVRTLVKVNPSGALLEASVQHNLLTCSQKIDNDVSRINAYGNQSSCIKDARLKKYCFCKNQISG